MSWTVIAYVLAGLFVAFYVLPSVIWRIARLIDRYLHPSTADSLDATPKAHQTRD